jgi:hypothetical protein
MIDIAISVTLCLQILFYRQYAATFATYLPNLLHLIQINGKIKVSHFKVKTTLAQTPNCYVGYPESKFRLRILPLQRCGHDGAHACRVC